jgi:hypothetical protein
LNQIERVVGIRHESSCEAIQPVRMRVEQSGQAIRLIRLPSARDRLFTHTLLNG